MSIFIDDYDYAPRVRRAHPKLARMISDGAHRYESLLRSFLAFLPNFQRISISGGSDPQLPHWVNGWIPALDAISIYGLLASNRPRLYVEVGSGNSTRFARQAIRDHDLATRIISIDPSPRADIDALCDVIIRQPLEEVDVSFFSELQQGDILFIDGSHRAFQNSDATVFLTHVVPSLPSGVMYGMHDVFLPLDYGESVLSPEWPDARLPYPRAEIEASIAGFIPRFYSEQYLMASYLLGGAGGDRILLPCAWITSQTYLLEILMPVWDLPELKGIEPWGGAFWMRRSPEKPRGSAFPRPLMSSLT
jgi:Methyltransferase domain